MVHERHLWGTKQSCGGIWYTKGSFGVPSEIGKAGTHFAMCYTNALSIGNTPLDPRILVTCKILVERGIAYPLWWIQYNVTSTGSVTRLTLKTFDVLIVEKVLALGRVGVPDTVGVVLFDLAAHDLHRTVHQTVLLGERLRKHCHGGG